MKKHEIHTIVEKANRQSKAFLYEKANAGYEIVSVNFTYYEAR